MSQLYSKFDISCKKYNVFKLYTIGDCYVLMSRNNDNLGEITEAMNVIKTGLEMVEIFGKVKNQIQMRYDSKKANLFTDLNIRVGIHTVNEKNIIIFKSFCNIS